MSRILHQLKKDLAHQRWALAGWATLLLVHLLLSGFQILRHVPNPDPSTEQFVGLVASWVVFLPLLFVILVVQSDTPVGTSAFWLTRPLRGPQMLAAKALFVALLFVLLPLAVEMVVLWLRGAGTKAWMLLPEFTVVRLPVVLAAFALGAATQRFLHALTLATIGSGVAMLAMILGSHVFFGGPGESTVMPFSGSRGIVAFWALGAIFATVVVVQFLTRRERLSHWLFVLGIGGVVILQMGWPWNVPGRSSELRGGKLDQVDLQIEPEVTLGSTQVDHGPIVPAYKIAFPAVIGGGQLSSNEFLAPLSGRLKLSSTSSSDKIESAANYSVSSSDPGYRSALESQFLQDPINLLLRVGGRIAHAPAVPNLWIPEDEFEAWQRGLEGIQMGVDVGLFRFEGGGELPLQAGAIWSDEGDEVEVVSVHATRSTLTLEIREQVLSLVFATRGSRHSGGRTVLLLVNRGSNRAILLQTNQSQHRFRGASWISPFLRSQETIELNMVAELGETFTEDAAQDWLKHSKLVIVRRHELGRVHVESAVDAAAIRQGS